MVFFQVVVGIVLRGDGSEGGSGVPRDFKTPGSRNAPQTMQVFQSVEGFRG